MSAPARPPLEPGDELAHYRIEQAIGEGAMGIVYRAHDTALDRTVAVKVLRPETSTDERFVKRFVREARAAARVSHPNLAHIYFIGEQDGRRFFAMEYIDGMDLEAWVEEHGPLPLDEALDLLLQAARGLRAAHQAGVVHRDVKPSNLLRQTDGIVRITDFGLAKSLRADVDATQAGLLTGTPTYMSPEQCRGTPVDHRTDVYALGLTAFYLFTGRKAYDSESLGALIDDQIHTPLPSLRAIRPELPEEADEALGHMCAKRLDDRCANMDDVIEGLERCRRRPVPPAPIATRFMAATADVLLVAMVVALVNLLLQLVLGLHGVLDSAAAYFGVPLLLAAYFIVMEARWGYTVAKWIFGLRVASIRGGRPRLRAVIPRFAIRYPWVVLVPLNAIASGMVFDFIPEVVQILAILAALVTYAGTRGRTLSDVVTRTGVTPEVVDYDGKSSITK